MKVIGMGYFIHIVYLTVETFHTAKSTQPHIKINENFTCYPCFTLAPLLNESEKCQIRKSVRRK